VAGRNGWSHFEDQLLAIGVMRAVRAAPIPGGNLN
jgi:hypothetical protein